MKNIYELIPVFVKRVPNVYLVSFLCLLLVFNHFNVQSQVLNQKSNYYDFEIKLPQNWSYKNQEIKKDYAYQITCWDNNSNINVVALQGLTNNIEPTDFIQAIKNSLNSNNLFKVMSFSNYTDTTFQEYKAKLTTYWINLNGDIFHGKLISFNLNRNSYLIMYQGDNNFMGSQILNKILASVKIGKQIIYPPQAKTDFDTISGNWIKYDIENIGSIEIPSSLEIRDENSVISLGADIQYGHYNQSRKIKLEKPQIVFQPKGVNNLDKEAFKKYCRILINIEKGKPGDYYKINEISGLSQIEIKELNNSIFKDYETQLKSGGSKIISWNPIEINSFNKMTPLKISYLRQSQINTPVYVEEYRFYNYDEIIKITLSYRKTEEMIWSSDLKQIIRSFTIKNIKL
jgi:hypothetical protein